jgi:iron(III) transport system substrate-binding protein
MPCRKLASAFLLLPLALGLAGACPAIAQASGHLVVYCPHPVDFINAIVQEFEVETGIKVEVVQAGTGELLRRVEAESHAPKADVMWGGSRASLELYRPYFEPYVSKNEASFMPRYIDASHDYTPFTAIPTVFMYNRNLVPEGQAPRSWADLLDPRWRGTIAFADPGLSSSSFEALINMLFAMGKGRADSGWGYVEAFLANLGSKLLPGSSAVYNGVASGEYALGITFEEAAEIYVRQGAPVGIVYPGEGTIVEPDGVAVIRGARNRDNARLFIDFVTSKKVQAKIARDLNRRSCRSDVPAVFGLPDIGRLRVIEGDYVWAGRNREAILARFKELLARTH